MEYDELGKEIVGMLYDAGMIKFFPNNNSDGWMLHSGIWSPFYIQMRPIFSTPRSKLFMDVIGDAMAQLIGDTGKFSKLVGIASAGVPISVIASYKSQSPHTSGNISSSSFSTIFRTRSGTSVICLSPPPKPHGQHPDPRLAKEPRR